MAKSTTLQKIVAEAKRIQKVHTHMSWKEAIKDASKHIKEGAKTTVKKTASKKAASKKAVGKIEVGDQVIITDKNSFHTGKAGVIVSDFMGNYTVTIINNGKEQAVLVGKRGVKKVGVGTIKSTGVGATYTMMTKDTMNGREIHGRINGSKIKMLALIDQYGIIDYKLDLPEVVKAEVRAMAKEKLPLNGWVKSRTGFLEAGEKSQRGTIHNYVGHRVPKGSVYPKPGTWSGFEQINGTTKKRGVKYIPGHEIIIGKVSDKVKLSKVVPEVKVKINRGKKTTTDQVLRTSDAVEIVRRWLTKNKIETQEYFIVMYLDRALKVLGIYLNTIGTMNSVMIDRRLVYSAALQLGAQNMIVFHNHPSGTLSPSDADISFTKELVKGAKVIEVPVQDHIILTKDGFYSFSQHNKI